MIVGPANWRNIAITLIDAFSTECHREYEFFRTVPKFPTGRNLVESERSSFSDCPLRAQSLPDIVLLMRLREVDSFSQSIAHPSPFDPH
jgi:hypothetical protein